MRRANPLTNAIYRALLAVSCTELPPHAFPQCLTSVTPRVAVCSGNL